MKRTSLAAIGLVCLATQLAHPAPEGAASPAPGVHPVAVTTSHASRTSSTSSSSRTSGRTAKSPGDDTVDPDGIWRCFKHPRECFDPLRPHPVPHQPGATRG